jgi:hypothetical protein
MGHSAASRNTNESQTETAIRPRSAAININRLVNGSTLNTRLRNLG